MVKAAMGAASFLEVTAPPIGVKILVGVKSLVVMALGVKTLAEEENP